MNRKPDRRIPTCQVEIIALIQISNAEGKIIFTKNQNSIIEILELGSLNSGIYYLEIVINDEKITYKIVKL